MDKEIYLVKLGEIALKGQNRNFFEKKLKDNIKFKLRGHKTYFTKQKGRFFIETEEDVDHKVIENAIATTFGVVGFAKTLKVDKKVPKLVEGALKLTSDRSFLDGCKTFKVETVRSDKGFELDSYGVSRLLGAEILKANPNLKVDVHNPDKILYVEIRDKGYLYTTPIEGPKGLPVGSAGKAVVMLSGGIDSPVASYLMAKRGLKQEAIYFHAYPYTSDKAKEKVIDLARELTKYHGPMILHVVPFTDVQLHIKAHSDEREGTLMMRACMVAISNIIASKRDSLAIISGESLSQVASQTLESLAFTNSIGDLPIFRPLIGFDKQEIISLARQIGTYETSILPYDDCCTIFSPKHPIVRPDLEKVSASYKQMNIEHLLEKAVEQTQSVAL